MLVPLAGLATTLVPHTLADRAREADRVALVQVIARQTVAEGNDPRRIKTYTELAVGEDLKGTGPRTVTLVQLGGTWGAYTQQLPGDADFALGETALVFLKCNGTRCFLVALGEGKIQISGDQAFVHDLFTHRWARRPVADLMAELRTVAPAPLPIAPRPVVAP